MRNENQALTGKETNEMAQQDYLYLLKRGVMYWNQWRQEHPEILLDLSKVTLGGVDLTNINLSKANLTMADLSAANLKVADLSLADIRGAILDGAIFDMTILDKTKKRRGWWSFFS